MERLLIINFYPAISYRPYVQERTVVREIYYPTYYSNSLPVYTNPYACYPYYRQTIVEHPLQMRERVIVHQPPAFSRVD